MSKKITRLTILLTVLFVAILLTCGGDNSSDNDNIAVDATITEISKIDFDYAYAEVRYNATGTNITEVGVMYSTTPGRLNPAMFDTYNGEANNTDEFGIVSGLPSVTGTFGADLRGLKHSTRYYAVPYLKLDRASSEFYKGYFVPTGAHKSFETLADHNSSTAPAAVSATTVASVTYTGANLSAEVTAAGSPGFNDRGFCYGIAPNPVLGGTNNTCVRVSGTGIAFSQQISGLNENTTYYVRAYIVNESFGTRYGTETNFRMLREAIAGERFKFTDERDGQEYWAVDIDGMIWMAENLNFEMDSSWCYENFDFMCEDYGRLYSWGAAMDACPAGWFLPERVDWADLVEAIGTNVGRMLRSETGWSSGNGTDDFGFTALPGGSRNTGGGFSGSGANGNWWCATENGLSSAYSQSMSSGTGVSESSGGLNTKRSGYSVRCVRGNRSLTTNISLEGSGTITRNPNQENYKARTVVTITANAASGYVFWKWAGTGVADAKSATTTVSMNAARILTAHFVHPDEIFTDPRDSQNYRVVEIGGRVWMAENLNYESSNSWCYNNNNSAFNCDKYGRWYAGGTAINACPVGWSLPSSELWRNLVSFVGDNAGTKLKSKAPNWDGTDDYDFSALPGGRRGNDGNFYSVGTSGGWWSSTPRAGFSSYYYYWSMSSGSDNVREADQNIQTNWWSVRCIKN